MYRERHDLDSELSDQRLKKNRRDALDILLDARDRLLSQLCDEILSNRDVILEDSQEGLFSFEFQEIEDRYSARLHALNSILENLEYRRPRIAHRVEAVNTTRENLTRDLNEIVGRFDQWDLVDIDVTALEKDKLLVIVGFTADEYVE